MTVAQQNRLLEKFLLPHCFAVAFSMFFSLYLFKSIVGIKRLDGLLYIHINKINIIVDGIQNSLRIVKVINIILKIVAPTPSSSTLLHRCIAHKPVRNFRKRFLSDSI
jgi:hypothetical protein